MKTFSKDKPEIVRSNNKVLVPYNVTEVVTEEGTQYEFYFLSIEDIGQDISDPLILKELSDTALKHAGVLILGVMCSATAEDMWGLSSIRGYIEQGNSCVFYFSNGNKLTLTPANIQEFEEAWMPFRESFFKEGV